MNKSEIFDLLINNPSLITKDMINSLNDNDLDLFMKESEILEKNYHNDELSKKKQINSLYGALANEFFPLYDVRLASSITSYGRYYIKSIGNRVNDFLITKFDYSKEINQKALIYTHTDSTYFNMKPVVEYYLPTYEKENKNFVDLLIDKGKEYSKIIDAQFNLITKVCNSKESSILEMDFENIADVGIFSASANYFIRSYYNKRKLYEPSIKIVGMEMIKSSTPTFSKDKIKNSLSIFLDKNENEIFNFIKESFEEFKKEEIENISFNKTINDMDKFIVFDEQKLVILDLLSQYKNIISKELKSNSKLKDLIYKLILSIDLEISKEIHEINLIEISFQNLSNLLLENHLEYLNDILLKYKFNILHKLENILKKDDIDDFFSDDRKYFYKKGTSIHVLGAITFNEYIYQYDLNYQNIFNGDKIKYIYLKKGNPFNSNVISFNNNAFIKDLNLKKWIDYETQFEKSFINPLSQITRSLGITINKNFKDILYNNSVNDIDSFF